MAEPMALGRKRMTHDHGSEYQVRIRREDETEELSGWMSCPEKVAQAIAGLRRWRARSYWLQVRNICCNDCLHREGTIAEFPLTVTAVDNARVPSQADIRRPGTTHLRANAAS